MGYDVSVAETVLGLRAPTRAIVRDRLRRKAKNIRSCKRIPNCLTTTSSDVCAWPKQLQNPRTDRGNGSRQIENKRKKGNSRRCPELSHRLKLSHLPCRDGQRRLFEHSQGTGYVHLLKLAHGERRRKGDHCDACPKEAGHRRYVYREYDAHVGVAGGDQ